MGSETKFEDGRLMYKIKPGIWAIIPDDALQEVPDIGQEDEAQNREGVLNNWGEPMTMTYTFDTLYALRKKLRRKRLCKILMSVGISRNTAEKLSRQEVKEKDIELRKIYVLALTIGGIEIQFDA